MSTDRTKQFCGENWIGVKPESLRTKLEEVALTPLFAAIVASLLIRQPNIWKRDLFGWISTYGTGRDR